MKRFLLHSALFLGLLAIPVYWLFSQADGHADPFYLRFTTPEQKSLVLGTSRAAQGIRPDALNQQLPEANFYNYSFTIMHSPYGPVYYESIRKKLDPETKEGVFILSVDPWSISSRSEDPNDEGDFFENKRALANTHWVAQKPNVAYLLQNYEGSYYELFEEKPEMFLHDDGWLEITIKMLPNMVRGRIKRKVKAYTKHSENYRFSETRLDYLKKIISHLQEKGDVYLVRLPISKEIMEIENGFMPDFNKKILELSKEKGCPFLDMTPHNDRYIYTDGNHLYKDSALEASEQIGKWIQGMNNVKP
ncbi:MAG: hypothetical protein KTR22_11375 [Flavobacteriaceae bacterium]|nr:hypothetical protein [Flavobacteriaceae bacterium]